ncbi:MAG: WD40 repeat domain-containing protein [Acidobacteria bacterium]|nr:WD40 repeat domain-containing protein [Acidobacteriota bacterium]
MFVLSYASFFGSLTSSPRLLGRLRLFAVPKTEGKAAPVAGGQARMFATFATTHWSVVLAASGAEAPEAAAALETLCHTKPLNGSRYFGASPDGRYLISESRDSDCFVQFDLLSGIETPIEQTRRANSLFLAASPDGRTFVSSPHSGKIVFWDRTQKRAPVTLTGHDHVVWGFAFTSDGQVLASASLDQTIRLWDVAAVWHPGPLEPPTVQHGITVHAVCFSSNSKYLASIHWEDESHESTKTNQTTVKLWEVATHAEVAMARQPGTKRGGGHRIAFSPDARMLAADDGGILRLYSVPALLPLTNWLGGAPAFSSDPNWIFYLAEKRILGRHLITGEQVQIGEQPDYVGFLSVAPDGATLVESRDDGAMIFYDVLGRRAPLRREGHQWQAWGLAFSPDGQTLASASWDFSVILWNVKERRKTATLRGHNCPLWQVAFSPDGRTLATAGYDKTVHLWNLQTGRPVVVLRGHSFAANAVAFSPDRQWLASGDSAGAVRFWRAPTFEELVPSPPR